MIHQTSGTHQQVNLFGEPPQTLDQVGVHQCNLVDLKQRAGMRKQAVSSATSLALMY